MHMQDKYLSFQRKYERECQPKLNAYSGQISIFSVHNVATIGNECTQDDSWKHNKIDLEDRHCTFFCKNKTSFAQSSDISDFLGKSRAGRQGLAKKFHLGSWQKWNEILRLCNAKINRLTGMGRPPLWLEKYSGAVVEVLFSLYNFEVLSPTF